ncbi:M48 family metallopeptidase [Bradyrhizobium sp. CCBAU 53421]|uniref:M48 family metallopeptidase n=1 Tax=Bradyrhizobium sp. CCBAU 53421 TaxID=1325120 RepID=UPI00188AACFB|nr:M48 family metallopeptidase [Bradyrhizobium sp. CCBAU 53421]QOZ32235.1 metalloendopeptidase [Bradyrhizobium sp. CCBAU 53421]
MEADFNEASSAAAPVPGVVYFDGASSRRRIVALKLSDALEIRQDGELLARWAFHDIRSADSPSGLLRLSCLAAPALARLEIRDAQQTAAVVARCDRLEADLPNRKGVAGIVGWSLAAAVSIVLVVLFGVPLAAERLTPLVPDSFERRLGDVAEAQVKVVFDGTPCSNAAGQAAFEKLVGKLRQSAGLDTSVQSGVLATPVPNAFALPGGKVYLFEGLLEKAENPDEIAGVLAHELGHLRHRDSMRELIHNGGTSFLIGLLFGDITGSGALIFASRSLVTSSYSRDAETNADTFAIETMHKLGRPAKPMGELMFRVTGKEGGKGLSLVSSHPLTEDRLARMDKADATRPAGGQPLLSAAEWQALKNICAAGKGKV